MKYKLVDITKTIEPRSDQINFDDVATERLVVTVAEVKKGSSEQPVEIHLVEFPGRPYKPSKSMRRVLVAAWGGDAANYPGRTLTLYGDPTVRFGGQEVGGIKIAAMSHLDGPVTINLTVTRGKRAPFTVQPLGPSMDDAAAWLQAAGSLEELAEAWKRVSQAGHGAALTGLKDARKKEFTDD